MSRVARSVLVLLSTALTGCGSAGLSGPFAGIVRAVRPQPQSSIARAELPDPAALVRRGEGFSYVMQLHSTQGDRRIWLSADRIAVVTDQGRIVSVAGITGALSETRFTEGVPPKPINAGRQTRLVDIPPRLWGLVVECRTTVPVPEVITILGEGVATRKVDEVCRAEDGTRFTDSFWIDDADGSIRRARQWIGPGLLPLTIELVRPPAS